MNKLQNITDPAPEADLNCRYSIIEGTMCTWKFLTNDPELLHIPIDVVDSITVYGVTVEHRDGVYAVANLKDGSGVIVYRMPYHTRSSKLKSYDKLVSTFPMVPVRLADSTEPVPPSDRGQEIVDKYPHIVDLQACGNISSDELSALGILIDSGWNIDALCKESFIEEE